MNSQQSDLEFVLTDEGYDAFRNIQGNRILIGQIVRGSWMPLETFSMSTADLQVIIKGMSPFGRSITGGAIMVNSYTYVSEASFDFNPHEFALWDGADPDDPIPSCICKFCKKQATLVDEKRWGSELTGPYGGIDITCVDCLIHTTWDQ